MRSFLKLFAAGLAVAMLPALAQAQIAHATQKKSSIMADQTRDALRRLADSMRKTASPAATPVSTLPPQLPQSSKTDDPRAAPK